MSGLGSQFYSVFMTIVYLLSPCVSYTEVLATSNTCFAAVNTTLSASYLFTAPRNGIIEGFKLTYNSGAGVTCDYYRYANSYWGCSGYPNSNGSIMITLTSVSNTQTATGQSIYPSSDSDGITYFKTYCSTCTNQGYRLSGYDYNSNPLIITSSTTFTTVTTSDIFSLQWCEPACGSSTGDNAGSTCATVYFLYTSFDPTPNPTDRPTVAPTDKPSISPTSPTDRPSDHPSDQPSDRPTESPTDRPTDNPTNKPSMSPTNRPTESPTDKPSMTPTSRPTMSPSDKPTGSPSGQFYV